MQERETKVLSRKGKLGKIYCFPKLDFDRLNNNKKIYFTRVCKFTKAQWNISLQVKIPYKLGQYVTSYLAACDGEALPDDACGRGRLGGHVGQGAAGVVFGKVLPQVSGLRHLWPVVRSCSLHIALCTEA